jgi:hypothetical protein
MSKKRVPCKKCKEPVSQYKAKQKGGLCDMCAARAGHSKKKGEKE